MLFSFTFVPPLLQKRKQLYQVVFVYECIYVHCSLMQLFTDFCYDGVRDALHTVKLSLVRKANN